MIRRTLTDHYKQRIGICSKCGSQREVVDMCVVSTLVEVSLQSGELRSEHLLSSLQRLPVHRHSRYGCAISLKPIASLSIVSNTASFSMTSFTFTSNPYIFTGTLK